MKACSAAFFASRRARTLCGGLPTAASIAENTSPARSSIIAFAPCIALKRHNHLIEARYRLTLQEQRLLLWLFSEIKPEDTDFKRYRVRIADLAKLIGISD